MDKELIAKAFNEVYFSLKGKNIFSSQGEFADKIGKTQQYVSAMLNGNKPISTKTIAKIQEAYGVNLYDYLATNKGGDFDFVDADENQFVKVPYVSTPVEAGLLFMAEQSAVYEGMISVPVYLLRGTHPSDVVVFSVNGDSMLPRVRQGDYAVCKKLTNENIAQYMGDCLIVVTDDNNLCKRFKKLDKETGHIVLSSDNELYEDLELPLDEIKAMCLVLGLMTSYV